MIPLSDKRWKEFEGGYRIKYDASVPLSKLENGTEASDSAWSELWEELFHQGDVGIASCAAIPHVARIVREREVLNYNPFALAVSIELAREQGKNPELPEWLREDYYRALRDMAEYACSNIEKEWDQSMTKAVLSLVAIVKGNRNLGELIIKIDEGYERYALDKYFEE